MLANFNQFIESLSVQNPQFEQNAPLNTRYKMMFESGFKTGIKESIAALTQGFKDNQQDLNTALFIEVLENNTVKIESIVGGVCVVKSEFLKQSETLSRKGYVAEANKREQTTSFKFFDHLLLKMRHAQELTSHSLDGCNFDDRYDQVIKKVVNHVPHIKTENSIKIFCDGFAQAKDLCIASANEFFVDLKKQGAFDKSDVQLSKYNQNNLFSTQCLVDTLICMINMDCINRDYEYFLDSTEGYADTILNSILNTSAYEFIEKIDANSQNDICRGLMDNLTPKQQVEIITKTTTK